MSNMKANEVITRESQFLGEKYYYIRHSSGLGIYVFPKELTTSYALLGTRYGSIDNCFRTGGEGDFTVVPDGIAHFLEHKMFENENGEDTFLRFARTGASANAYTSFNMTAYLYSCTAQFYESLEILLDYVTHPYFTPENVEKEQGIIAQEIRMGEDNPDNCLLFGMLGALYAEHTVRLEIAGTVESISKITSDLLYQCYRVFYNLNNMALIVCGDVDVDNVLAVADSILQPQPEMTIESVHPIEKPEAASKRFVKKMQVAKPLFNIGVKDTAISSRPEERLKKGLIFSVLDNMLFSRSGRFYNELYEEGLITKQYGYWAEHNKSFSMIFLSGESNDPEEIYSRFLAYIDEQKENGLNREDFERSRRVIYAAIVRSFDNTEQIANNLLEYVIDGSDLFEAADMIGRITYEECAEVFVNTFKEEYFALAAIYPLDTQEA